jgi:hypothetical protein
MRGRVREQPSNVVTIDPRRTLKPGRFFLVDRSIGCEVSEKRPDYP